MSSRFYAAGDSDSDETESSTSGSSDQSESISLKKTNKNTEPSSHSRFLKAANSESDESSSAENESTDDDHEDSAAEDDNELQTDEKPAKLSGKSRFLKGAADSDTDEDEEEVEHKRVVRSARDRRYEDMRAAVKSLKNASKINDWIAIQTEFDKLNKFYSKATTIIQKEGNPRFYIRTLTRLEDFVKKASEETKDKGKKMNPSTAKAFTAMKQRLKKHNKLFETEIIKLRDNFVDTDASQDEADVVAMPEAEDSEDKAKATKWASGALLKSTDDSGEEISEEESAEQSSEEAKLSKTKKLKRVQTTEDSENRQDEDIQFTLVGKGGKFFDVTPETLFKKLKEMLEARGKKSTDKPAQVVNMKKLLEVAYTAHAKIRVLLALIPAQFDSIPSSVGFMNVDAWRNTLQNISQLLTLLETNPHILVTDDVEVDDDPGEAEKKAKNGENLKLRGGLASFVDRLDDEFTKSLQNIDPHTTEYVDRFRDETALYGLLARTQRHFTRLGQMEYQAQIIMRRVEHIYYKPDHVIQIIEEAIRQQYPSLASDPIPSDVVSAFCTLLYKTVSDRIRIRALLCHVYHYALNNQFYKARDLLLMSHLQDTVQHTDIHTQLLFNRTMVQIGLSAFRCGLFKEAYIALQDIQSTGRTKEMLAQGIQMQKYVDKTPEQERLEKSRQLPFHMHINLELIECVYLTCSMLLEISNMAMTAHDTKRKVISKQFRRLLDYNERQIFIGPPENTRDHIMAAAKALASGDWQRCTELIASIKIWDLMPNSASIKEMLARKIQEEGLRTYFFTYASYYDSLGLADLSFMFSLPIKTVYSIISKMIINEELNASLDQVSNTVILHRPSGQQGEITRLQLLAGLYAEKVGSFVEGNERLLDARAAQLGLAQRDISGTGAGTIDGQVNGIPSGGGEGGRRDRGTGAAVRDGWNGRISALGMRGARSGSSSFLSRSGPKR